MQSCSGICPYIVCPMVFVLVHFDAETVWQRPRLPTRPNEKFRQYAFRMKDRFRGSPKHRVP